MIEIGDQLHIRRLGRIGEARIRFGAIQDHPRSLISSVAIAELHDGAKADRVVQVAAVRIVVDQVGLAIVVDVGQVQVVNGPVDVDIAARECAGHRIERWRRKAALAVAEGNEHAGDACGPIEAGADVREVRFTVAVDVAEGVGVDGGNRVLLAADRDRREAQDGDWC